MLRQLLDYLRLGWRIVNELHTAHWVITSFVPVASLMTLLASFWGEHSAVFLVIIFVISLGIIGMLGLAALGYRQKNAPQQTDLANRIFHYGSEVDFCHLRDEHRITFTLTFINASNEFIVLDDVTGSIAYGNFLDAGVQPTPQLGQRKTDNAPLREFKVALEQHVSRELTDNLLNHLCGGQSITINLENLLVSMRSKSGSEPFSARLRQGIVCTRKQNVIVFEHLVIGIGHGQIESLQSRPS
jgi:hypothetical protein